MALPEELAEIAEKLFNLKTNAIDSLSIAIEEDWSEEVDENSPIPYVAEISLRLKGGIDVRVTESVSTLKERLAPSLRDAVHRELEQARQTHKATRKRFEDLENSIAELKDFVPSPLEELAQQAKQEE